MLYSGCRSLSQTLPIDMSPLKYPHVHSIKFNLLIPHVDVQGPISRADAAVELQNRTLRIVGRGREIDGIADTTAVTQCCVLRPISYKLRRMWKSRAHHLVFSLFVTLCTFGYGRAVGCVRCRLMAMENGCSGRK
ncbi:uncharacterized protein M421DRAFT_214820 [Didymella exigua CBS 183.55]|uniref:Uncharacterized protein n=1 Tax=Didymella exigua CBS 183.55 TaxID=1150837 RepID=A0A6A5RDL8_9PLEO|nr:uncharacterized protein M421DRAFT_214820 [Didymella exigua CBS 183.55]KAF1926361.1 hypothetical protein M421DRAFT_214820 [Didymella exigua CBS 183.55]